MALKVADKQEKQALNNVKYIIKAEPKQTGQQLRTD